METLRQEVAALRKHVVGPQSEKRKSGKMPPALPPSSDATSAEEKRRANRDLRDGRLETEVVPVSVPEDQRGCPKCGNDALRVVGAGKPNTISQKSTSASESL